MGHGPAAHFDEGRGFGAAGILRRGHARSRSLRTAAAWRRTSLRTTIMSPPSPQASLPPIINPIITRPAIDSYGEGESAPGPAVLTSYLPGALRGGPEVVAIGGSLGSISAPPVVTFAPVVSITTIIVTSPSSLATVTIVPFVGGSSYERRAENASTSYASYYRDASATTAPARSLPNATAEAEGGIAKVFEPGLSVTATASLTLNGSSISQSDAAGYVTLSTSDDGSPVDAAATNRPPQTDASDNGELIDRDTVELARQKRKLIAGESLARLSVSPRLERLADLPVVRDAASVFLDLARATDEAIVSMSAGQRARAADASDDGMIELLATDLAIARSTSEVARGTPRGGSQAVMLQAEIAVYQAFEIDAPAAGTQDGAEPGQPAVPIANAAAEQLARSE